MKNLKYLFLASLSLTLIQCTNDDQDFVENVDDALIEEISKTEVSDNKEESNSTSTIEKEKSATEHGWGYEGSRGPASWGGIKSDYSICSSGKNQSPINLKWKKPQSGTQINFNYMESKYSILNNGHTIQINFDTGSKFSLNGHPYELVQMHFHSVSEHQIGSKSYPMEIHLVHKDKKGTLAVVGLMVNEGYKSNPIIDHFWKNLPKDLDQEVKMNDAKFNIADLLPKTKTYYNYKGSLTTPPCSEGVNWYVFNTPIELSKEQIDLFRKFYNKNNRPLQALNGRKVVNY